MTRTMHSLVPRSAAGPRPSRRAAPTARIPTGALFLVVAALASAPGCAGSGDGAGDPPPAPGSADPGGTGLGPGGAQDFGRFKAVLEAGKVPSPDLLDQVGFFAEHHIGAPPTDCLGDVCARARVGSMANLLTGSNCTLVHLALGSPLDPKSRPRPALDVALVVDVGSPALATTSAMASMRAAASRLLDGIQAGDTVTLVAAGSLAVRLGERVPFTARDTLRARLSSLVRDQRSNLYDGLRAALDALGPPVTGRHRRLVLVSAGAATAGLTTPARLVGLVRDFAETSGGVSIVELGGDASLGGGGGGGGSGGVLRAMADLGAGVLYDAESAAELPGLLEREVSYSLVPVAEKVRIRLTPSQPWRPREVFGVKGWELDAGGGTIDIPALFVAWRSDSSTGDGRRGGGGGIFVEVLRTWGDAHAAPTEGDGVLRLDLSYVVPGGDGTSHTVSVTATEPKASGAGGRAFADASVEKGFVVLNLYVALRMAATRASAGDVRGAWDVLHAVELNAGAWNRGDDGAPVDAEIADDLGYITRFRVILERLGALQQPPRAGWFNEPWPRD